MGDLAEAMVVASLLRKRWNVCRPIGEGRRYDLVIEKNGKKFYRVQCKHGRFIDGAVEFKSMSTGGFKRVQRIGYVGAADFFGVYCPANETCYLVPVGKVNRACTRLRVEKPRNNQKSKIRFAAEFKI